MQWWAWIAVGAVLLGSELAFVDAQFYLVFIGASALVVGFVDLAGVIPAPWAQWLLFALLSVFSMLTFRRRIYDRLRRNLPTVTGGLVGETLLLPSELTPGATCRVEYRGSTWNAVNAGASSIEAGARARIERVDGLTLALRPDP